jgi:hypothetical protein
MQVLAGKIQKSLKRGKAVNCYDFPTRAMSDFEHVDRTDRLIAILILINAVALVLLAFVL